MADEAVDAWLKPYERPNDTTKAMSEYLVVGGRPARAHRARRHDQLHSDLIVRP